MLDRSKIDTEAAQYDGSNAGALLQQAEQHVFRIHRRRAESLRFRIASCITFRARSVKRSYMSVFYPEFGAHDNQEATFPRWVTTSDGKTTKYTVLPFNTALDPKKAQLSDDHMISMGSI